MDEFVVQNGLVVSGSLLVTSGVTASISLDTISRGGTVYDKNGITNDAAYVVWRAPFDCTVNTIYAYREGGSATNVNALNGTSLLRATNYSIATADTWLDVGTLQNTSVTAGTALYMVVSGSGASPTQVSLQLDITRV